MTFLPSAVLDSFLLALPLTLIGGAYGAASLGQFVLAQRVVTVPVTLIGAVLADVYHSRFVAAAQADPRAPRRMLARGALLMLVLGICTSAPLAALSQWGFDLVVGKGWHEAAQYVLLLAPWAISGMVTNPLSRAMMISAVPQLKLISDAIRVSLPAIAILAASWRHAGVYTAVVWFSVAVVVGDIIYYLIIRASIGPTRLLTHRPPPATGT